MAFQKLFRAMDDFNHHSLLKDIRMFKKHTQAERNMMTGWKDVRASIKQESGFKNQGSELAVPTGFQAQKTVKTVK